MARPVGVIIMQRESVIPALNYACVQSDTSNFHRHFALRKLIEDQEFGIPKDEEVFQNLNVLRRNSENLNDFETTQFIRNCHSDACIIFGSDIIKGDAFDSLPPFTLNFHLGLSPWYRGSTTLFWPFYFMQPQFAGATIHKIVKEADAGSILHQTLPNLAKGMGIHDVGAATVKAGCKDLVRALEGFRDGKKFYFSEPSSSGRLFLTRDFLPHHLRVNYDYFGDRMVDAFLDGSLEGRLPRLVQNI